MDPGPNGVLPLSPWVTGVVRASSMTATSPWRCCTHSRLLQDSGGIGSSWRHWWHLVAAPQARRPASSWLLACGSQLSSFRFQRESGSYPWPCLLRPPAPHGPAPWGLSSPCLPFRHPPSSQALSIPTSFGQVSPAAPNVGPGVGTAEWLLAASETPKKYSHQKQRNTTVPGRGSW